MYGDWPSINPMPEQHAIALITAVGYSLDLKACADGLALLREAVDLDDVDAILSTCTMVVCASRLLPREGHLDYDDAVLRSGGLLPLHGRIGWAASQFLHLVAKLNGGVNADPRPLLETDCPLIVALIGVTVAVGYVRVCAEILETPLREVFTTLLEDMRELQP